jgi:hypothetical protein
MTDTARILLFLFIFGAPVVVAISLFCESIETWIKRSVERWMPWLRK